MRIVFSRKGFDSTFGNLANPILLNGDMVAFPIPAEDTGYTYSDLQFQGKTYYELMWELNPKLAERLKNQCCHIDPDLENRYAQLGYEWNPAFGQMGIAERHLENQNVQKGDIFLFFGWFKQTELDSEGKLCYKKDALDMHAIYGYMEVGEKITGTENIAERYPYHPHAKYLNAENNALYIPSERLSIIPDKKGYGVFNFSAKRRLTAENADKRGIWLLPKCFRNMDISYHSGDKTGFIDDTTDYFYSAARGQEFVCDCGENEDVLNWLKDILSA